MSVAVQKMKVPVILLLLDDGVRPHIPLKRMLTKLFTYANAEDAELFHKLLTEERNSV